MFRILLLAVLMAPFTVVCSAEEESKADKPEVHYVRMYPDFITNLASSSKPIFLQVRIELMTHGEDKKKLIEYNEPLLRDKLILLFNTKSVLDVKGSKARHVLQDQALKLVQSHLKTETGETLVEKVYFTKVIIE